MKPIKTLLSWNSLRQLILLNPDVVRQSQYTLGYLTASALLIWYTAPMVSIHHQQPFGSVSKRIEIIAIVALLWLLKWLTLDLDNTLVSASANPKLRRKLLDLHQRFQAATNFLKKNTFTQGQKTAALQTLPWYVLIGPSNAGKTSLLAHSNIPFILQRRYGRDAESNRLIIDPSAHLDWWATREASIIDVPSHYLFLGNTNISMLWRYFLRVTRYERGTMGVNGIILALPLAEWLKNPNPKALPELLQGLLTGLKELATTFPNALTCQIILTKCDLLPGFNEFFAESPDEDIQQAWGINLLTNAPAEKLVESFTNRFNALIKKINEQLLWRIHQERNPLARPYIKDFPLQLERVKLALADFLKKVFTEQPHLIVRSVHLTSALQPPIEPQQTIIDDPTNSTQRGVQLFRPLTPPSRAYFAKQLLTTGLGQQATSTHKVAPSNENPWPKRAAIAASVAAVCGAGALMGEDFQQGVKASHALQNQLSNYQIAIAHLPNASDHLQETVKLLNTLELAMHHAAGSQLQRFFGFYSHKSMQETQLVYEQTLQRLLLPEIKNYFSDYLRVPGNHDVDTSYAVLKAYMMLGDPNHRQQTYIIDTVDSILPPTFDTAATTQLKHHLAAALNNATGPLKLDANLASNAQHYFSGMNRLPLAYVILRNIGQNSALSTVNWAQQVDTRVFSHYQNQTSEALPQMFTGAAFGNIIAREAAVAATEAVVGNWVIGNLPPNPNQNTEINALTQQLQTTYVNQYIHTWEGLVMNTRLTSPNNLIETDQLIERLSSNNSPLLNLLQTLRSNTYFEPIASYSSRLTGLSVLITNNQTLDPALQQILVTLGQLHHYLQPIVSAPNQQRAAYYAVANRMAHHEATDSITELRMLAARSPEPLRNWLDKIADDTWRYMVRDASRYIDLSWQEEVGNVYQQQIANRYPFANNAQTEVDINTFSRFFSNSGTMAHFFTTYLQPLVDNSQAEWRWKSLDNVPLPFNDETLRHIQHAFQIQHAFFPNNDNKPSVRLTLQAYQFDKSISQVKFSSRNHRFVDNNAGAKTEHVINWPMMNANDMTTVQLILTNQQTLTRYYPGTWGIYRLVNQSFENALSSKQIVLNISSDARTAKYVLLSDLQPNPFLSANLRHFNLPTRLVTS